jgi:hypothetical protein
MGAKYVVLVIKKLVMHKWMHICGDVDSGQDMEKTIRLIKVW